MHYYLLVFKKYAEFSGRATRKEYWYFVLFNFIISLIFNMLIFRSESAPDLNMIVSIISMIYSLAVIIPSLAVFVRRMHDTGRRGWWFFLIFIPIIGAIWLLTLTIFDSQPGENKYGPNHKSEEV
ncbi:MAG TPA: DUF805 domain-containing protein [Lentisphaeria bacterium]|nr:MAG: hypothetical protein A2X47_12895 [Lentisphaerae bacterium GWF2_38_69]HBM14740.1 DUF805 domain-containing protein [Lentisphaeria bacterium]